MSRRISAPGSPLALLLASLCLSGLVQAQETAKPAKDSKQDGEKKGEKKKEPDLLDPTGMKSAQDEMKRLFHEVETTLGKIDVELADAGAGNIPVPEGKESGIEKLLHSTDQKSGEVVDGIDKILELAAKMNQGQGGGTCMKSALNAKPGSQQSPLDKERQRGPTQEEQTPEAPKPSPSEKNPQQGQQQPQPQPAKPDDRGKNPPPGENHPADPRNDPSGPPVTPGSDAERWGMLPERVRQVFKNQITDDLPLQYRDWIDSYYRRLNGTR